MGGGLVVGGDGGADSDGDGKGWRREPGLEAVGKLFGAAEG
jgi:hypothetical protein